MAGASSWSPGWPALLPLAGFTVTFTLGVFVWSLRGNTALQRSCAALNIAVALWNLDVFLLFVLRDGHLAQTSLGMGPQDAESQFHGGSRTAAHYGCLWVAFGRGFGQVNETLRQVRVFHLFHLCSQLCDRAQSSQALLSIATMTLKMLGDQGTEQLALFGSQRFCI